MLTVGTSFGLYTVLYCILFMYMRCDQALVSVTHYLTSIPEFINANELLPSKPSPLRLDTSYSGAVIVQNTFGTPLLGTTSAFLFSILCDSDFFSHIFNIFDPLIYPKHQAGAGCKIRCVRHSSVFKEISVW